MKSPEEKVEELLATSTPPPKPRLVHDNPALVRALVHFLDLKERGETHITLHWFYTHKLRTAFDGPASLNTIKDYVRNILQRDFQTGKPL